MKNISYDKQLELIKANGWVIENIINPTEEMMLEAINYHPFTIASMKHCIIPETVKIKAVSAYGYIIEHIKDPSEKLQKISIKGNVFNIALIKNKSENIQIYTVNLINKKLNSNNIKQMDSLVSDYIKSKKAIELYNKTKKVIEIIK
jgi:hypothetical protein